jgi:MoxR-vWA-beta-propeller ternary system domain bpX2
MTGPWAVLLPQESLPALGPLRRVSGVTACERREGVWLQGPAADVELEAALRALPGGRRYTVLADGQLVAAGTRVPHGYLPEGPWLPLPEWFGVRLDPASLAGRPGPGILLQLVPSSKFREAAVLLTTLDAWSAYAGTAPQIRLDRWSFALSDAGEVIVRGTPLPPIRGLAFVESEGIAVPAGWTWTPLVDAAVLRDLLGLEPGDLALLRPDGPWDRLPADVFVRATRSAVRLTSAADPTRTVIGEARDV